MDDSRFDHADGIDRLLQDFSESFGEKEFFRQGGAIREFEAMGRLQGESITAFVRRLRLLERKLLDSRVPTYPEQARVIKLLDGMRLDERSTSSLLLAAGNRYEMKPILDAIWPHYPAGMSVTGLPLRAAAASSRKVSQKQRSKRSWHTDWHDGAGEDEETYGPEANEVHDDEAVTQTESDDVEYHDEEPEAGSAAVEDIWPLLIRRNLVSRNGAPEGHQVLLSPSAEAVGLPHCCLPPPLSSSGSWSPSDGGTAGGLPVAMLRTGATTYQNGNCPARSKPGSATTVNRGNPTTNPKNNQRTISVFAST